MTYRLTDLDVSADSPYRDDALDRKPVVDFLADLLGRTGGPFVLALDAPWGSGKTTVVKMLIAELQRRSTQCIYFNAWRVDHAADPLVALVSSIDKADLAGGATKHVARSHLEKLKNIATKVARRGVVAAFKAGTFGFLDVDATFEQVAADAVSGAAEDIVSEFQKEEALLESFREELGEAVRLLPTAGKSPTLVWFIDELDRCRPNFAIALLERVKHLFDVSNVVFVLSIDKSQLEISTSAIYGNGMNASEYLRRFIDLEFKLPCEPQAQFTELMIRRIGLEDAFDRRKVENGLKDFVEFFTGLARLFNLSLRAQERCITRLRVLLDHTPDRCYLEPILVSMLLVLRSSHPKVFQGYVSGELSPLDVFGFLREQPGDQRILEGHLGAILEAQLIAADPDSKRFGERRAILEAEMTQRISQGDRHSRAEQVHRAIGYLLRGRLESSSAGAVGAKIDFVSTLHT